MIALPGLERGVAGGIVGSTANKGARKGFQSEGEGGECNAASKDTPKSRGM